MLYTNRMPEKRCLKVKNFFLIVQLSTLEMTCKQGFYRSVTIKEVKNAFHFLNDILNDIFFRQKLFF